MPADESELLGAQFDMLVRTVAIASCGRRRLNRSRN
jgi:hypothetical protein